MKKTLTYLLTLIGLLTGCTNDPNWGACGRFLDYQEEITTKQHYAKLAITFNDEIADALSDVELVYSKDESFADYQRVKMTYQNKLASIELNNLDSEVTYYVHYVITPEFLQIPQSSSFQTINHDLPLATTMYAYNITPTSARLRGAANENGSYEIIDKGIIYTLVLNDSTWNNRVSCQSTLDQSFDVDAENLRAGATYYFFAYATNRNGTAYGDTISFTTPKTY